MEAHEAICGLREWVAQHRKADRSYDSIGAVEVAEHDRERIGPRCQAYRWPFDHGTAQERRGIVGGSANQPTTGARCRVTSLRTAPIVLLFIAHSAAVSVERRQGVEQVNQAVAGEVRCVATRHIANAGMDHDAFRLIDAGAIHKGDAFLSCRNLRRSFVHLGDHVNGTVFK